MALGMFLQISVGECLERAGWSGFTLDISVLDGIGAVRDLRGHVLGALARGFKRCGGVGADGGAQRLAGVGMTEAIGERAGTVRGDSQNKSGLPQVCDLEPFAAGWLCAA